MTETERYLEYRLKRLMRETDEVKALLVPIDLAEAKDNEMSWPEVRDIIIKVNKTFYPKQDCPHQGTLYGQTRREGFQADRECVVCKSKVDYYRPYWPIGGCIQFPYDAEFTYFCGDPECEIKHREKT